MIILMAIGPRLIEPIDDDGARHRVLQHLDMLNPVGRHHDSSSALGLPHILHCFGRLDLHELDVIGECVVAREAPAAAMATRALL